MMIPRTKDGFTLVETLIALAILAFAIIGLLMAMQTAVEAARYLRREAQVRQSLENRLATLRIDTRRELRQEVPADATGVSYLEEIIPEQVTTSEKTVLEGYRRIRVKAFWKNERGESAEQEASFLAPTP